MSAAATGQEVAPAIVAAVEVEEWEVCACCGLREECTPAYAAGVRARYGGRWLCGLCGDAVSEEVAARGGSVLEVEAAIARHAAFCRSLDGRRTPVAAERLIAAVRRLLRNAGGKEEKAVVVVEIQEAS
ncbi:hypothetical protein SEVIR_9G523300v4 [Setaria viridis]|uniref:DUF1677 family protein n=2 Tax=Setaria TaxID=4554 RepID=K4AGM3_SETIT|nr:uncharacterized protein LOC101782692 [Setaria italica]XP_034571528.1 uncharacterized protein LOC117836247 [Setaria viridis]RCV46276.1 hypothetical protein SETIT_9G518600v2 [Setaria italica]TKV97881.1 hypothetical protein SEVIR_9G523300v2 [Setaria viridis]